MEKRKYYNKLMLTIFASFLSGVIFGIGAIAYMFDAISMWKFFFSIVIYGFFIFVVYYLYSKFHKTDGDL